MRVIDLVGFASDAAFGIDENGRIAAWNEHAENLLGHTVQDALGQRCWDILRGVYPSGEPLCTPVCEARSCFSEGCSFSAKSCRVRHQNGELVPVSISSLVVPMAERGAMEPGDAVAVIFFHERRAGLAQWARSDTLRIFTLGHFGLVIAGMGLDADNWKRKQALTVLKCLTANVGRSVHRERLIETLWPGVDSERGWERLKVTVSFLRNQLRGGHGQGDFVVTVDQSYMLRSDAVWIDSEAFERLVHAGQLLALEKRPDEALLCFEDAKNLYKGDYLEDDPYADWYAEERVRLRELHFEMLADMAACHAALNDYVGAVRACREALSRDPARESFLRALIENLTRLDRADWVEPLLESWRRALIEDHDVVPSQDHLKLIEEISRQSRAAAWPVPTSG